MSSDSPTSGPGLVIYTIEPILSFLISTSTDPHLSKELQQTALNLYSKPNVPYRCLLWKHVWMLCSDNQSKTTTGLHVVVTIFTGYLVGYAAFRALFNHIPVMNAAGGILGLKNQ
ncbi:hypothetical protein M0R45_001592 [Rubus argutus]|uniref:Uncharacterized protein n=1 Tax=Rubus argutus TaxID=59490 RepID=A0AAW1VJK4_RUBAR